MGHSSCEIVSEGCGHHDGVLGCFKARILHRLEEPSDLLCFSQGLSIFIKVCICPIELLTELLEGVVPALSIEVQ